MARAFDVRPAKMRAVRLNGAFLDHDARELNPGEVSLAFYLCTDCDAIHASIKLSDGYEFNGRIDPDDIETIRELLNNPPILEGRKN